MSIDINKKAPEFALYNTFKKEVNLGTEKDRNLVLLFFPLAFTSTCTTELCSVRDSLSDYNQLNATVYGISVDSLFTLAKFKEEQKLNFDLLSDFNREASRAYACLYSEFIFGMKDVSKRAAFVIDAKGILRHSEILEKAGDLPSFDQIFNCLKHIN